MTNMVKCLNFFTRLINSITLGQIVNIHLEFQVMC